MKSFLKIFILLLVGHVYPIEAQEYKPYLVTEGKQWASYFSQTWNQKQPYVTFTFRLQGDTIINGNTYKKIWESRTKDLSDMSVIPDYYMREENGKVYTLQEKKGEELWFDYTSQVGDTLCFARDEVYGVVISIDDVVLEHSDGEQRKCYEVRLGKKNSPTSDVDYTKGYNIKVYEDIGVLNSPTHGYGLGVHRLFNYGNAHVLLYVHDNGKILYQSPEGCYKETSEVENTLYEEKSDYYHCVTGRKVAHPTRGIYIKDGKKVLVKGER